MSALLYIFGALAFIVCCMVWLNWKDEREQLQTSIRRVEDNRFQRRLAWAQEMQSRRGRHFEAI